MKAWLLLPLLLAGAAQAQPASAPASSSTAGAAAPAAAHYREVLERDGFSAPALAGFGDAWLRAGRPGRAILQYQRALVLAPQNPALEQALARARQRAGVSVAPAGPWARAAGVLSDDAWAWIEALSVLALCAALGRVLYGRGGRWTRVVALAGACGVALATDVIVLRWPALDLAVVVQGPAAARIAPADAAAASFELRAGESVYIEDRFHDFERIRTADGRGGWLRRNLAPPVRVTAAEAATEEPPP